MQRRLHMQEVADEHSFWIPIPSFQHKSCLDGDFCGVGVRVHHDAAVKNQTQASQLLHSQNLCWQNNTNNTSSISIYAW